MLTFIKLLIFLRKAIQIKFTLKQLISLFNKNMNLNQFY